MGQNIIEELAEAPAVALEKTVDEAKKIGRGLNVGKSYTSAKAYWHKLGPGLTTGAADDDPSGIGTYSQAGAAHGFSLLWLALFTFPLMAIIQEMCARIGLVTGRGLAANIRNHFPPWMLYSTTILLFAANTFNIGADLGAMATASQLLRPEIPFAVLVIFFTTLSLALQIFVPYQKYAHYLKWLALVLLVYIFSALSVRLDWGLIFQSTVIPNINFSKDQLILICAILGTTISPYLFFWQSSQEVEEEILDGKTTVAMRQTETSSSDIKNMRIDVWTGMFVSNLVMFFIIAASAATLNAYGVTNIATAADAAQALRPIAGESAYFLFTLGIIGTGLLAVPILAGSASYAISESFGWKQGLYRKLRQATAFYGVIIIAMLIGFGLNFSGLDPIKALVYSAVANGLVAPIVLVSIILISANAKIMGSFVNHKLTTIIGWVITAVMIAAGLGAIYAIF